MSAWGPNGIPFGVNLGGAVGGGFVQPERLPMCKAFHEVDTVAPRIPDRLANPVRSWVYDPPMMRDLSIVPKPEPLFMPRKAEFHLDLDPQFTLSGRISSKPERTWDRKDPELEMPFIDIFATLGKKGLLR